MLQYTNEQLATLIAVPIVTILLIWTIAIFHKNRKKWGAYDIPIVAILVLSILRNATILTYTILIALNQNINLDYCSIIVWIFNSVHTFQASSLTTLAVIGLFSAKLYRKQQRLRQFLTATHVIYHLFCLTTLCACVGVAAILAQKNKVVEKSANFEIPPAKLESHPCSFMPFQLDIKFNVFIIVLHVFLAVVSVTAFLIICYHHYKVKRNGFDYLKKSTSDLSDLSLGLSFGSQTENGTKTYYDTYTIHKSHLDHPNYYDSHLQNGSATQGYQNGYCNGRDPVWNSDVSNISTTVSSTNSRRPCISKQMQDDNDNRTGLETIHPVLIVCYLFNHLPLIILCIFPRLLSPWTVAGAALWLGLLQDLLIPISLGLVDTRFCKWISSVYRCSDKHNDDKLPHVGLDGKFRHFGSQPQSLDVNQTPAERNPRGYQQTEHKFPITNGSLYTSIDGRLPVIHNYRRNKDQRGLKPHEGVNIHSSHLKRQESRSQQNVSDCSYQTCPNCEVDLCSSRSNLHHLQHNRNLNLIRRPLQKHVSLSQNSLSQLTNIQNEPKMSRKNVLRLSKSEDSLNEVHKDLKEGREKKQSDFSLNDHDFSSSDDEYFTDNLTDRNRNFDTLSSKSCYSITTEANCDFEFFQSKPSSNNINYIPTDTNVIKTNPLMKSFKPQLIDVKVPDRKDFRITRSNSKRSLENFQAYVDESHFALKQVQRSNSYISAEDRKWDINFNHNSNYHERDKLKSAESLRNSFPAAVYVEEPRHHSRSSEYNKMHKSDVFSGSVPDFKRIFISDYI